VLAVDFAQVERLILEQLPLVLREPKFFAPVGRVVCAIRQLDPTALGKAFDGFSTKEKLHQLLFGTLWMCPAPGKHDARTFDSTHGQ
jgi:hypothetical protein